MFRGLFPRAYRSRTVRFIDDADGPEKENSAKKKKQRCKGLRADGNDGD